MLSNTSESWGLISKVLHWGMGLLIVIMLVMGLWMASLSPSDLKWTLYWTHKSLGLLLFILVGARLAWRFSGKVPTYPEDMPAYQKFLSTATVIVLYGLMIGMPLTGLTMSLLGGYSVPFFDVFTIPAMAEERTVMSNLSHQLHTLLGWFFFGFLFLHVMGAAYHSFVRRDHVVDRMWFSSK